MRPRLALSVLLLLCFMPVQLFAVDMNLIIVIDPIVRPDFGEIQIPDYDFTMQDCSATVVTENSTYDTDPSLHNGQLAWSGEDPNTGTRQIFLWNVDDPVGTASMVTSASIDGRYPSLYNGQIAYKSTDSWFNGNISMYDGTQNSSVTTGEDTWAISPSLYHNGLAYSRYEDGDFEIYYQAGLSTQQITDNTTNDSSPSLYNGTIAWMGHDGSDYEIYYWDGSTVHQITNNSYDDTYPSLYAGTIAWQGQNSTTSEIFYWNGSTILQITNDNSDDVRSSLYDGKIAWASDDGHDYEIKYWDGSTIRTVTDNGVSDSYVSLYNGAIAWVHDVTADSEIHYCEIDPPLKPAVETQSASDITDEAAQLNAMINPNEQDTAYMFEYGTSDGYGSETASTNLGDGSVGVEVNAALSGLQYSTTYHYRIVATNAAGVAYGSDQTFATQGLTPVLPTASTGSPTGTYESITMAATINPNGFETSYSFEYGTDTSYGSQTTSSSAGSGLEVVSVLSELDGLSSNTTYHYRIVATNAAGSVQGDDQSLTTMAVLAPTMMAPSGQQLIPYFPVALPIKDITPASARPFAVGDLLGGTLNLQVGLSAFSHAVDIYLGVQASVLGTDVLLIDSTGALQPLGSGLVAWKSNNFSGVDNEAVFGAIDVSTLPNDNYTLYLMVVPAGETHLMNYYLWKTDITINN